MNTLFKNATIITMNKKKEILKQANLLTIDGKIAYMGSSIPETNSSTQIIDCSRFLLLPGLINTHTHVPMILLRGLADDCSLQDWLNRAIWPAESTLTRSDVHWGTLLGISEMLAYGTTSFSDMYHFSATIASAVAEAGIKATLCNGIVCRETSYSPSSHLATQEGIELIKNWNGYQNGLIRCDTSIQSEFQTIPAVWETIAQLAQDYSVGIHMHLSETLDEQNACIQKYKKTPTQLFQAAGVFESRVVAAHCNYISEEDMDIFSSSHATIVHDPCSNLKMCSGFVNLKPMFEKKINIALGTDGVCSNNSSDLFETMKFTALNQKMCSQDPTFFSAADTLTAATLGGAIAQGREHECGTLEIGKDADLIAVDTAFPGHTSAINSVTDLVYSTNGSHVALTMVRGNILYQNGEFKTLDIEKIKYETNQIISRFR